MFDNAVISSIAFALFVFLGLLMFPYLIWKAWGRIAILKEGK